MDDSSGDLITLHMPVDIWAGIDGEVDNVVSMAVVDGDEHVVRVGQAIREAGWEQVPWVDGQWPPMDQVLPICLSRGQWELAGEWTRQSLPVYEELQDEESAQGCRDALAVIEASIS